jgi:hypothetical protein
MNWRWLVAIPVVALLVGGGAWSIKLLRDRSLARDQLGEMMCCLTGIEPVDAKNATRAARRMLRHDHGSLDDCIDQLERAAQSERVEALSESVFAAMAPVMQAKPEETIPHLASLYAQLAELEIKPSGCSDRPLHTVIASGIAKARDAAPGRQDHSRELDDLPLDAMTLSDKWVVEADDDGKPLSRLRPRKDEPYFRWPVRIDHRGELKRGKDAVPFGKDKPLAAVSQWVLWHRDGKLVGRKIVPGATIIAGPGTAVPLSGERLAMRACGLATGDVLALYEDRHETYGEVTVVEASDELNVWGSYPSGPVAASGATSPPTMACGKQRVTLTWARSTPNLVGHAGPRAVKDVKLPPGPHPQVVHRAVCTSAGCTHEEVGVGDIPPLWRSVGGWSSPMYLEAVTAVPLGDQVLLWWRNGSGLYSRLGKLSELATAPTRRLVDIARPEEGDPLVPDAVNHPAIRTHVRGDALLLSLTEARVEEAGTLFLRMDGTGAARLLMPSAAGNAPR